MCYCFSTINTAYNIQKYNINNISYFVVNILLIIMDKLLLLMATIRLLSQRFKMRTALIVHESLLSDTPSNLKKKLKSRSNIRVRHT